MVKHVGNVVLSLPDVKRFAPKDNGRLQISQPVAECCAGREGVLLLAIVHAIQTCAAQRPAGRSHCNQNAISRVRRGLKFNARSQYFVFTLPRLLARRLRAATQ